MMRVADALSKLSFEHGVYYQDGSKRFTDFEDEYLQVRKLEGRVYSDEEVHSLPYLETSPTSMEWTVRKVSSDRLLKYIRRNNPRIILEIGCGNGWLSNQMTKSGAEVIALDINETELLQGARVFRQNDRLHFVYGNIFSELFSESLQADFVILSSVLQYFNDPDGLIRRLASLLSARGEIHIIDTPIYRQSQIREAALRSEQYYNKIGINKTNFYFHHSWEALQKFDYDILYDPKGFITRIRRTFIPDSPFYWIRLRNLSGK